MDKVQISPASYDFAGAKWIGRTAGECPCRDALDRGEVFGPLAREGVEKGLPKCNSQYFRREIEITKHVDSAIIRTVGLGFYEMYINGKKVGDKLLTPYTTEFSKKILYDVYDVTDMLVPGKNTIAYELGGGWFAPDPEFSDWRFFFYGNQRLILSMDLNYYDGTTEKVVSDENFRLHDGPVTFMSIFAGEKYDARLELPGWNQNGFDDSAWANVVEVEAPGGTMFENIYPPVRCVGVAAPLRTWEIVPGMKGYAFAENLIGWLRVRVKGPAGAKIMLNHSENLNADGTLNAMTNRKANNEDEYILSGNDIETFEPTFTWHNFQYAAITVFDPAIEIISVEQINVRSDIPFAGKFTCSEPEINTLHEKFMRTQLDCLMGVPIDCPQRDERLGWLGDAYITGQTCLYNLDMRAFYMNFMEDMRNTQNEAGNISLICPRPHTEPSFDWTAGYPVLAMFYYMAYGDDSIFREYYDSMHKLQRCIRDESENYNIARARNGDWMSVIEGFVRGDPDCLTLMLFCWITDILRRAAKIIGREEDLAELNRDYDAARAVCLEKYYDADGRFFKPNSQCANALGLMLGLCPEGDEKDVLNALLKNLEATGGCFDTGILGTKFVLEALEKYDRQDVIYSLFMQDKYPSWRELLNGRSTLPEKWNGGGSGCHAMFDVGDSYFYTTLAGLRIDHTADTAITFKPWLAPELTYAKAELDTVLGTVKSGWMKSGEDYIIHVTVPVGECATFVVHPDYADRIVCVNGRRSLEREFRLYGGDHVIYVTDDERYVRYNL